jgi:anti-sigma regulatory factor (Ser/Thr protein kinase)
VEARTIAFAAETLGYARKLVREAAERAGASPESVSDFLIAVNEIAENSVRHGSGGGRLSVWAEDGALIAEVADEGRLTDPLVGRRRPADLSMGGYGLWVTHQVCDLVQVRSSESSGTRVRAHMRIPVAV